MVGADDLFPVTPEVIHQVEMRTALREPQQADAERLGEGLRASGRVNGVLIQEPRDGPGAVMPVHPIKELLEFHGTPAALLLQKQRVAAVQQTESAEGGFAAR